MFEILKDIITPGNVEVVKPPEVNTNSDNTGYFIGIGISLAVMLVILFLILNAKR